MLAEITLLTKWLKRLIAPFLEWRRRVLNKHMSDDDGFDESCRSSQVEKIRGWFRAFWAKEANREKVITGVIIGVVGGLVIKVLGWIFG